MRKADVTGVERFENKDSDLEAVDGDVAEGFSVIRFSRLDLRPIAKALGAKLGDINRPALSRGHLREDLIDALDVAAKTLDVPVIPVDMNRVPVEHRRELPAQHLEPVQLMLVHQIAADDLHVVAKLEVAQGAIQGAINLHILLLRDVMLELIRLVLNARVTNRGQPALAAHPRNRVGELSRDIIRIFIPCRVIPKLQQHLRAGFLRKFDRAHDRLAHPRPILSHAVVGVVVPPAIEKEDANELRVKVLNLRLQIAKRRRADLLRRVGVGVEIRIHARPHAG